MQPRKQPPGREIRVFISSTFRDMQDEREELVKQVFPKLRRLCESRGVTWGEVDLRWGIPDETMVLPLCLAEIERCRPYFIGLLGERYGSSVKEIPEGLLSSQPWLKNHKEDSITALEIHHGVLGPNPAKHAFFYFRDPDYAVSRADFVETDTESRVRLSALKEAIRKTGFPVAEGFRTPGQLGEWVLRDFTALIDDVYPETSIPDPLDRAASDHEAYAVSRRQVYVSRREYMERCDAHAEGDGPPLVVLGESGVGKSALLANWEHHWSKEHPGIPVIKHFIGATVDSADWIAMLHRVLGEFQRLLGSRIEVPHEPMSLRAAFANALHMVAARGRTVLILDALDQLEDRDGAPDLVWLPSKIRSTVRLIVSTLPGRSEEALRRRDWQTLTLKPLELHERQTLMESYLSKSGKRLGPEHTRQIAAAPQAGNGLHLTVLLNELRQFGSHEGLGQCIESYLQAADPLKLYRKVIERWEQDFGKPATAGDNIVRDSLVRLWAARRGLSESELLELLGASGYPMPRHRWSSLFLALGDTLVNRDGLMSFRHHSLREAVRDLYLPKVECQKLAHRRLARYFQKRANSPRQLEELPWQLAEGGRFGQLYNVLKDATFLEALMRFSRVEMLSAWASLESHSTLRRIDAYSNLISLPLTPEMTYCLDAVAFAMEAAAHHREALQLRLRLLEHTEKTGDRRNYAIQLGNVALTLKRLGKMRKAVDLLKAQLDLCLDSEDIQRCLGNIGFAFRAIGEPDIALKYFRQQGLVAYECGHREGLGYALAGQGLVAADLNQFDRAAGFQMEAEREARFAGNLVLTAQVCGYRAEICRHNEQLEEALKLHKEQERICLELGDADELAQSWGGQGLVYAEQREYGRAFACWERVKEHAMTTGHVAQRANALANLATISAQCGRSTEAKRLFEEAAELWRELDHASGLATALANQALILCAKEPAETTDEDRADIWRLAVEALRLVEDHNLQRVGQQFDRLFRVVRSQMGDVNPET